MTLPALKDYQFEEQRLEGFKKWPFKENSVCNARKLAEAGFIFIGSEKEPDLVQCQVCLKNLQFWEEDDDPWMEHAKHSPSCMFVKIGKQECDLTVDNILDLNLERTKNIMKEEHAARTATFLALRDKVRAKIVQLRKLKK